jgi:hypothetical protein
MSRVSRPAGELNPPTRPAFPIFTSILVMALLLVIASSVWHNRHRSTPAPQPAAVAEPEQVVAQSGLDETSNLTTPATGTIASGGQSAARVQAHPDPNPSVPGAGSIPAGHLIGQLAQLQIAGGKLSADQGRQIQQTLQQLVGQGPAALPAIREFLDKNVDLPFGEEGPKLAGAASLRGGLIDTLRQIGGPESLALSRQILQNTADPLEISLLARNLEEGAPGQYRQEALDVARQALSQAATGNLDVKDVGPLFQVLQTYGDPSLAADLEKASAKWGTYATLALAGLPSGDGIPSLIKMAQGLGASDTGQSKLAVQMLAQLSGQYPDAGSALVEMARQNQIPDTLWRRIVDGLAGDQYQIGLPSTGPGLNPTPISGLKTYHLEGGNQNFYSVPVTVGGSVPDVSQRLATIDQLLAATAGNPAATAALNRARAGLTGK